MGVLLSGMVIMGSIHQFLGGCKGRWVFTVYIFFHIITLEKA